MLKLSIVIPAFNEESIITKNLSLLFNYLKDLGPNISFEIVIINDGSTDRTGELAESFSKGREEVKVFHHLVNLNLGNALKTGFANAEGEYIITLDLDLSYALYHISDILDTLVNTKADVVLASAYMKGGKVTGVPIFRRILSKWANIFLKLASQRNFHTYTCMVRGYRTGYIKGVNLKSTNYEINPEILYKSIILRANIIEIPAHLDWTNLSVEGKPRSSGLNTIGTLLHSLMAGFIFRPYLFYLTVGTLLMLLSTYIIGWIFIHTLNVLPEIQIEPQFFDDRFSAALREVYNARPYAFMIGGIVLISSIQFITLGFISLQQKRYFEELFHINSAILKNTKQAE